MAGNDRLMERQGMRPAVADEIGTVVHVAEEERYLGYIVIADEVKADAKEAVDGFKAAGWRKSSC